MHTPRTRAALAVIFLALFSASLLAQIPGVNVNMVTGTQWPGGDPFLQRQNEPSMAISSRNPLHMLAGANDYRTVDLPGVNGLTEPNGDAWLGLFKSFDGGQTWTSTLIPGYPQDSSSQGAASPLKGQTAAADPGVRAGTNGMFYYSGIAFNRSVSGNSKVFVASFIDNNNIEGGDSINYLATSVVNTSDEHAFADKPAIAVDIPRDGAQTCAISTSAGTQRFPGGNVYVTWTEFKTNGNQSSRILFSYSTDCGRTFHSPRQLSDSDVKVNQGTAIAIDPKNGTVYVTWRVFADKAPPTSDSIAFIAIPRPSGEDDGGEEHDDGNRSSTIARISPFDQGDTYESFRTNSYPSIAVDGSGHIYVAWTQRGATTPCTGACGDARAVVATGVASGEGFKWTGPVAVDPFSGRGHQVMPVVAFSAGKLTAAWYDLRDDDLISTYNPLGGGQYSSSLINDGGAPQFPFFGPYIQDPTPPYSANARRQTLDVRAAQAIPANPPVFQSSVQVSQYAFGSTADNPQVIQQLEVNTPNLPMFQSGTLPFIGDYIDIAGPLFVPNSDGSWRYNTLVTDNDYTHVVWTDNRNVVQPADGNWAHYTPPTYGTGSTSLYDPTQQRPACSIQTSGNTRDRNQDIYTAQLSPGLTVTARGNAKELGGITRAFPVTVQNGTAATRFYQLTIAAQPSGGGSASFLQFPVNGLPFPLTQIYVQTPALSSSSRTVFVSSTDPHATVGISVVEATGINGPPVSGGQTGSVTLNSDVSNPNISNPNISNAEIYNPNISNPNISNPNISNPNISNPNISNPNISNPNISNVTIANPNISNPNISNPNISNPNISNPNISNPNISNPNISNAALTDSTWTVTNNGNTAASYSVKMLGGNNIPTGVHVQLVISQSYSTPSVIGCNQAVEPHFVPVANIPNVVFYDNSNLTQPAATDPLAPSVALLPGETAYITLRVLDTTTSDPTQALQHFNPAIATAPAVVSHSANTGSNTPPVALVIVPSSLPAATATGAYSQQLHATGGTGTYSWSAGAGLPPNFQLSSAGVLSGTALSTGAGTFNFQATVTSGTQTVSRVFTLLVNPAPSLTTAATPIGDAGSSYSQAISISGGTAPLTGPSISSGTLPSTLTLGPTGITGTLPAAGSYNFTVSIKDANNVTASQPVALTVNLPPSITTASLSTGEVGVAYTGSIAATGGTGALSFTPATIDGVSLSSTGQLSGTPTSNGSFPLNITVTDSVGVTAKATLSLTIQPALTLAGATLPAAVQNAAYPPQQLTASNGVAPYSKWMLNGSSLPSGLAVNQSGQLTGPIAVTGAYNFTVSVSDSLGATATQSYTLTIYAPLVITPIVLMPTTATASYSAQLAATGGTQSYTWSGGAGLPNGITLSNTGLISGSTVAAGSFPFTATATSGAQSANISLTLVVNPAPSIAAATLASGIQGSAYSQTLAASGGTGMLNFTPINVDGVMLAANGQFSGTPLAPGSFPFTATVTDSVGITAKATFTLNVASSLHITTASLPAGIVNTAYPSTQLQATGGTGAYSNWMWTPAAGSSLVPGLNLDANSGTITGTPAATGTYSFAVSVSDGQSTAAAQLSITVGGPLSISGATVPVTVGQPVNYPIQVSGGAPPLNWSFTGNLPSGMTFANGVFGGTPDPGSFASQYAPAGWTVSGGGTPQSSGSSGVTPNCPVQVSVTDSANENAAATFQIAPTPSSPCSTFSYSANGNGGGITGSWTFSNTAQSSGTLSFHWHYTGFHAFFQVTAGLQVFSGGNTQTLYSAGPQNCCTTPSNGFDVQGDATIAVTAGQSFGFITSGKNFDSNSTLNGTLVITNFSIQ